MRELTPAQRLPRYYRQVPSKHIMYVIGEGRYMKGYLDQVGDDDHRSRLGLRQNFERTNHPDPSTAEFMTTASPDRAGMVYSPTLSV
ncbi:hypothetical protein RRG08_040198 [Elysia crispata]|uniref:Uncharacterized protein n=1 Tax=Elysia crispata TaxID=231223 RepID=A0AAE0XY42_9GAST|nr:hypothetical protein RRG08_040198 [Elysia crispata]